MTGGRLSNGAAAAILAALAVFFFWQGHTSKQRSAQAQSDVIAATTDLCGRIGTFNLFFDQMAVIIQQRKRQLPTGGESRFLGDLHDVLVEARAAFSTPSDACREIEG